MKSNRLLPYLTLVFGCLLLLPGTTFAQKDSIKRDTIKEEYNKESDFYLKRREKYDYLTRAKVEELSMFKIYASYANFDFQGAFLGPSIGYEKKLSPDFSLFGEVGAAFSADLNRRVSFIIGNASFAGRYYYNMREKMWEGKSANNLSGNYISLEIYSYIETYHNNVGTYPFIEGLYGIQRRLGRLYFFDINGGLAFEGGPFLVLNGKFGFGL